MKRPRLPEKWIERIFCRLSAIYGHQWASRHPTAEMWSIAKNEWAEGLAGLTAEELNNGICRCRDGELPHAYPPNIFELRKLARISSKPTLPPANEETSEEVNLRYVEHWKAMGMGKHLHPQLLVQYEEAMRKRSERKAEFSKNPLRELI